MRKQDKSRTKKLTLILYSAEEMGGIPTQSATMSRMDGALQMSSDLENAKINTNMQLYYSTISAQN